MELGPGAVSDFRHCAPRASATHDDRACRVHEGQKRCVYLVDLSELKKSRCARSERIGKSYASRNLRLALLAPDIVEAILTGRTDQVLMLEKLERQLLAQWRRAAAHGSDHAGEDDAAKVWTPRPSAPAGVRPSVGGDER